MFFFVLYDSKHFDFILLVQQNKTLEDFDEHLFLFFDILYPKQLEKKTIGRLIDDENDL